MHEEGQGFSSFFFATRQRTGRRGLCALRRLRVGDANDYVLAGRPRRRSDRIERHRDIARIEQAIQL